MWARIRGFLHWQYASWFISLLFALGVAMWTYHSYTPAYVLISVAGAWALIHWQFSEFVTDQYRNWKTAKAQYEAKPRSNPRLEKLGRARKSFFAWNIVISALIVSVLCVCLVWVRADEVEYERHDVYQKLSIVANTPSGQFLKTGITVVNNGGTDIDNHTVRCSWRRITLAPYGGIENLPIQTTLPQKSTWRAFGGGETSYCLAGIASFPPDTSVLCADVTIVVFYTLVTQHNVEEQKEIRFVTHKMDNLSWHEQPVDYQGDYCPEIRLPGQAEVVPPLVET